MHHDLAAAIEAAKPALANVAKALLAKHHDVGLAVQIDAEYPGASVLLGASVMVSQTRRDFPEVATGESPFDDAIEAAYTAEYPEVNQEPDLPEDLLQLLKALE